MLQTLEEQNPNPAREEKAHAARLLKRIKAFSGKLEERAKGWEKAREYVDGCPEDDGEEGLVRVNMIGSLLETLQPSIYAKAPEISVTPDEHVSTEDYPVITPFSETLQAALNVFLVKDAKLKQRGKAAVRSSLTSTIGWVKLVYQVERREDPIIRNRINDAQDNVDQIKTLLAETDGENGESGEHEAKMFELKQQIDALNKQVEVVVSEGLVLDTISADDLIILDESCRDIDEYMQASEIVHRIKMTVGAFKNQFGVAPPKQAKKYVNGVETEFKDVDEDDYIVNVFEVWSMKDLTVYTICEGSQSYVREPYQPQTLGAQWYPFFGLQLRRVDGVKYPKSVVEQLIELQDEYNTRRTNDAEHRKKNIPVRLLNKSSGISDQEISAICNRSINTDVIGVTMDANQPLANQLGSLPEIPYNPAMYDSSDIMRDMEMVGNTQDAARGAVNKAKTATEAEIMSMGMQSRTGEALDVIEDWLSDIATYAAQLLLQNMPVAYIKRRFGQEAIWPELSKKELFEMVSVSIRGGSTARPNQMKERDQWLQLLPIIQQTMEKVTMAKQAGMMDIAEASIKLLDETLLRFDEKMDAKELLGIDMEAEGMPMMAGAMPGQVPVDGQPMPQQPEQPQIPQMPVEIPEEPAPQVPQTINLQVDARTGEVRKQIIIQRDELGNILGADVLETPSNEAILNV